MFKVTSPPSCARILFLPQGCTHTTLLASRHDKPSVMLFSAEDYSFCQKESMQRNSPLVWYPCRTPAPRTLLVQGCGVSWSWGMLKAVSRGNVFLSPYFGRVGTLVCHKEQLHLKRLWTVSMGPTATPRGKDARLQDWGLGTPIPVQGWLNLVPSCCMALLAAGMVRGGPRAGILGCSG